MSLSACTSGPKSSEPNSASLAKPGSDGAASTTEPADRPFLWKEAKLPKDFPPAGPVGEVIVKQYPAYRAARVSADRVNRPDQNAMFQPLFDHIRRNDVAMTAPVEMQFAPDASAGAAPTTPADPGPPVGMGFLYADPAIGRPGPDGVVNVVDLPPVTVVSVGVRGSYNAENFKKGLTRLQNYLAEHAADYRVAGPPRFLGYNSPFVPFFLRYGEVQIPVTVAEPTAAPQ